MTRRRLLVAVAVVVLAVVAAVLVRPVSAPHRAAPNQTTPSNRKRTGFFTPSTTNLLTTNPSVTGSTSYLLSGATYNSGAGHNANGSIVLTNRYDQVRTEPVAVTSGTVYTFSFFSKTSTARSPNIIVWPVKVDAANNIAAEFQFNGQFGNFGSAGNSAANTWEEFTMSWTATYTGYVSMLVHRDPMFSDAGVFSVDDFAIYSGQASQANNPGTRTGYTGSQVRLDADGNWQRYISGTWTDWFPQCASYNFYKTPAELATLATLTNCNMVAGPYAGNLGGLSDLRAAGLVGFLNVADYFHNGWQSYNWTNLATVIQQINASADNNTLVGYFHDQEVSEQWDIFKTAIDTIRANDGGRRPIVMLQSFAQARMFNESGTPWYDVLGSYYQHGPESWLQNRIPYPKPRAFCQFNLAGGNGIDGAVYGCIIGGGKGFNIFADGNAAPGDFSNLDNPPPIASQPMGARLPTLRSQIASMMPFIKLPEASNWQITNPTNSDRAPYGVSVRDVSGIGHMMLSGPASASITFTVASAPYPVYEVRDFFTNALIASPAGASSFTVPLNSFGTRFVKLLPNGGTPPSTTSTTTSSTTTTTTPPTCGVTDDPAWVYSSSVAQGAEGTGWAAYGPAAPNNTSDYTSTNHVTYKAGETVTITFNGEGIDVYGAKSFVGGRFTATIDGTLVTSPAYYSTYDVSNGPFTDIRQTPIYTKTGLTAGSHTLILTALGTADTGSQGTYLVVDKGVCTGTSTATTTTTTTTTTTIAPGSCMPGGRFTVSSVTATSGTAANLTDQNESNTWTASSTAQQAITLTMSASHTLSSVYLKLPASVTRKTITVAAKTASGTFYTTKATRTGVTSGTARCFVISIATPMAGARTVKVVIKDEAGTQAPALQEIGLF